MVKKSAQTLKPKTKKVSLAKKLIKPLVTPATPLTDPTPSVIASFGSPKVVTQILGTHGDNLTPEAKIPPSTNPANNQTPSGFTLEESAPKDISTPISATIPAAPSVIANLGSPADAALSTSSTSDIPTLDKKADLAIESITVEEELPPEEKQGILFYILGSIFGVLILAGVITLGVLYFKTSDQKPAASIPTPTPTPTVQITETPKSSILKNDEITFEVLNASGITGEAAKYGKRLEALGYKVNTLGNFPAQTGSTVSISKTLDSQKDLLIADLKKEFPAATFFSETTDSTSLVRFIIGK